MANELRDYLEPSVKIEAKTASGVLPLAVYGLTLEQAIFLARDYGQHVAPVYAEIRKDGMTEERSAQIMADLLTEAPMMINMICYFGLRTEDQEEMDIISKMPVGLRIEIVEAVAKMTFHSESGPGKILGVVVNAFRTAAGMVNLNAKTPAKVRKP